MEEHETKYSINSNKFSRNSNRFQEEKKENISNATLFRNLIWNLMIRSTSIILLMAGTDYHDYIEVEIL